MKSLILIFAIAQFSGAVTIDDALKEYGIKVDSKPAMTVSKNQQVNGASKKLHVIEAENSAGERFEIKIISPMDRKKAMTTAESESAGMKKAFAAAPTPYMGDIAQAIGGCPAKFGPIERKVSILKNESNVVIGSADKNFTFGACADDLAKYKGAFISYYDESTQSLWTWRVFSPWTGSAALKSDWLTPILHRFQK